MAPPPGRRARADRRLPAVLFLFTAVLALLAGALPAATAAEGDGLPAFLSRLWPEAHARGISRATYDAAFAGVTSDPSVLARTHGQAEFRKTLGEYLASAVSDKRVDNGRGKYGEWAETLAKVEARFGVDRYVILGVWGLESNFGEKMGDDYVIRSLATLAAAGYRGAYFRTELLKALAILQEGHIDRAHMLGSWAGAMGQTQFMPSNFKPYAVDFDGDGRRDIWTSAPDALASTANFLRKHGWIPGETWGYEVALPPNMAPSGARALPFATWAASGVARADGGDLPRHGTATLLRPAGADGPAFLVTRNFGVIKRYNNAVSYALGVALLGDRIAGWGPLKVRWPMAAKGIGRRAS